MTGASGQHEIDRALGPKRARQSMLVKTLIRVLRNPQGLFAVAGLGVLFLCAIFAGAIAHYNPNDQSYPGAARLLSPSFDHPFGTDNLRRDLFSRTVFGLRNSLVISLGAVAVGSSVGISIGYVAGYSGKWTEAIAMRVVDAMLAFPSLLAALAVVTILGPGQRNVGIAVAIFNIPAFARLARGQMLVEKNRDYVKASQALGAGPLRVIFRHISVNTLPPLLTQVTLAMSGAVLLTAALSFLGLGDRPPAPSLGGLVSDSKPYLRDAWWTALYPGTVLALLLLCLNFLADAVNEATSPFARRRA